jgi:hypothetical protein
MTTYQTLVDLGYKHIAFNHSSIAYPTEYTGMDVLKSQMYGRMELIRRLVANNIIQPTYYHHLLGCSLPQEFMSYGDWKFIKSVDTSNPILVGAEGVRYTDSGISFKPKEKLAHYFEKDLSEQKEDIIFNVNKSLLTSELQNKENSPALNPSVKLIDLQSVDSFQPVVLYSTERQCFLN